MTTTRSAGMHFLTAKFPARLVPIGIPVAQNKLRRGLATVTARIGLNYKINANVTTQAGYAWIFTYPYGEHTIARLPKRFPNIEPMNR